MVSIPINVPDDLTANEAQVLLAVKLLELRRVSLGKAAEVAGFSKPAFIEILGKYGFPILDYPQGDLEKEVSL